MDLLWCGVTPKINRLLRYSSLAELPGVPVDQRRLLHGHHDGHGMGLGVAQAQRPLVQTQFGR